MARFMALAKYSPDAAKGIVETGPAAREEYVRKALTESGATVEAFYFIEGGEWDLVVIADIPDVPGSSVATYLSNQGAGIYANWRGYRLFTGDEVQAAIGQVVTLRRPGS
jgi:uncharacterized protein with GYD domain